MDSMLTSQDKNNIPPPTSLPPIVGIGASAGGLEAIVKLLNNLSNDTGFAIVIIMHLTPHSESNLPQILGKATTMPVMHIKNNQSLKPNCVYVIPSNYDIKLSSTGKFKVLPRENKLLHLPIDLFFISLAEQRKEKSIGIILSGTGSDGALGIEAIRAEGGIIFVQKPSSAKHKTMPSHAILSGAVDGILLPKEIGKELNRIGRHPYIRSSQNSVLLKNNFSKNLVQLTDVELENIVNTLNSVVGTNFAQYKTGTLNRRIKRRMVLCKIDNIKKYVEYIRKYPEEAKALANDFLISVTRFFRDPKVFDVLENRVFPHLLQTHDLHTPIRIWVPGCATGEEVYSIVIILIELLEKKKLSLQLKVFATDISEAALKKARIGFFPDGIACDISKQRLKRFFQKEEGGFRITKEVRDLCIFSTHDIIKDPPFANIDFLSCRNLLIYFNSTLQKKVIPILWYALNKNGNLLLGRSDAAAYSNLFIPIDKKLNLFSKNETPPHGKDKLVYDSLPVKLTEKMNKNIIMNDKSSILKEVDELLIEKYAPPCVLINNQMEIILTRGNISLYLKLSSGHSRLNIMKMATIPLAIEIRRGVQALHHSKIKNYEKKFTIQENNIKKIITLKIQVLKSTLSNNEIFFLIEFVKPQKQIKKLTPSLIDNSDQKDNIFTAHQYQILMEQFETSQEAILSTNEALQSSNEELQSTNEELITTKEELESSNEELSTVNEELRLKNIEIMQLNADLNNFFSNISIPVILVDNHKRIRNFTPGSSQIVKLISSDIGCDFGNFNSQIKGINFDELLTEVITTMTEKTLEIKDNKGHWYKLIFKLYMNTHHKVGGAVILLLDIDDLKKTAANLQKSYHDAITIINTLPIPLILIKEDYKISLVNNAFCKTFGLNAENIIGKSFLKLSKNQWNIPEFIKLIKSTFADNINFKNFQLEHDFADVGRRSLLLNITKVNLMGSGNKVALLAIHDITHPKKLN